MKIGGFTLLELLVVLAIIGGMAAFLVPQFPSADHLNPRQEANQLRAFIEQLRKDCIEQNASVSIEINPAENSITATYKNQNLLIDPFKETSEEIKSERFEPKEFNPSRLSIQKIIADKDYENEPFIFNLSGFTPPPAFELILIDNNDNHKGFKLISNSTQMPLVVESFSDEN